MDPFKQYQQYIDRMFRSLPETEEIIRLKNNLYQQAIQRHQELIGQGKTESETFGTIVIEIGERDDLLKNLGYDHEEDLINSSLSSIEDAKSYLAMTHTESKKIALGVLLILIGAGLVPTMQTLNFGGLGVILLLVLVALAVGMFIMAGMKLESSKYGDERQGVIYISDTDYSLIEKQYLLFKEENRFRIPLGVMLCILSPIPLLVFGFMDAEFYAERFGVVILTTLVGIGVYQFIRYGMLDSAFQKILNIGEYSAKEQSIQKVMEPVGGIYWLIITLIYLIWSFTTMNWYISWIIWPIAGILWSIIISIIKIYYPKDNGRY